ncbi:hypothetical protein ACE6H2_021284 [Prunus campanulata]
MLNKFNVKEVGSLEERIVHLAMDEGLKLLKASLESNAVLTNVFLCGQLRPYPFQPIEVPLWMISRLTLKSVFERETLVYGDYPKNVRHLVKERLPIFTKEERRLLKGSFDLLASIIILKIW